MNDENESIGKLVRTLKNVFCPDCNAKLQLRSREDIHLIDGENVVEKNQYHYCKCGYFEKIKNEKFNRKREWAEIPIIPEPEPVKRWDKNKGADKGKFSKRG